MIGYQGVQLPFSRAVFKHLFIQISSLALFLLWGGVEYYLQNVPLQYTSSIQIKDIFYSCHWYMTLRIWTAV